MYVIIVKEHKPDRPWGPKARRRYQRRHRRPGRLRRLLGAVCSLHREICRAFECAHQQWVRRP